MRTITSEAEHRQRVKQLRRLGYKVKTITMPNGDRLVLTSKKRFVCRAHHCASFYDGGAKTVPWPKKRKR